MDRKMQVTFFLSMNKYLILVYLGSNIFNPYAYGYRKNFFMMKGGYFMLQGRNPGPWPNAQQTNRPFMSPPNINRMQPRQNPFFQQRSPQPRMGQMPTNGPFRPPQKGGILGKLFGRSKQPSTPQNLFVPPSRVNQDTRSGSGLMDSLKNPQGLSTMLTNTQKVLQAAEQFTPMIQQYGPIVKNIPSLWKLMRAINSSDDEKVDQTKETETTNEATNEKTNESPKESSDSSAKVQPKKKAPKKKKRKSDSVPKLYI